VRKWVISAFIIPIVVRGTLWNCFVLGEPQENLTTYKTQDYSGVKPADNRTNCTVMSSSQC